MHKLSWNRDEDGVIVIYATDTQGRVAPAADLWLQPLIDKLGMTRTEAMSLQGAVAERVSGALIEARDEVPEWMGTSKDCDEWQIELSDGMMWLSARHSAADLDRIADACRILAARRRAPLYPRCPVPHD